MIQLTLFGNICWLLPYGPNTESNDKVIVGAQIKVDAMRGLTGRASVRPKQTSLKITEQWISEMAMGDFSALRNATLQAQDQPILAPLWPFAATVGSGMAIPFPTGLWVAWTDGWASVTTIQNPGSYTAFAGYTYAAPLLYGRLKQPPRLAGWNSDYVRAEFSVYEDGAYPLVPPTGSDTVFTPAGGTIHAAKVFPYVPEMSTDPVPGAASVVADRSQVGPGRMQTTVFYPQLPERTHQASYRFTNIADAAGLIGWWVRRGGKAEEHWVATSQNIGYLANDISNGDTTLTFTAPPNIGSDPVIALQGPGATPQMLTAGSITGNVLSLGAAVSGAWPASWTLVSIGILARHSEDTLSLDFTRTDSSWQADCTLKWSECAPEVSNTTPTGEVRGTTLGRLPGAAWFFQIGLDYNGATETWYLTNYEAGGQTIAGQTWTYNDCTFDQLIQSLDLQDDACTFKVRWFDGGPWDNWLPGNLNARGTLTVCRADVSPTDGSLSNFRQVWTGELSKPTREGPKLSVKVIGANSIFSRKFPRQMITKACGTTLFSTRCTLLRGNWSFGATVASISGNVVTVGSLTAPGGTFPAGFGFADWFTLGYLELQVGGQPHRAEVLGSAALSGGQIVLTLDRSLGMTAGATVTLVPGCDRNASTCRAYNATTNPTGKFNNHTNFRGMEFMPAISPNLVIPAINQTAKK